AALLEVTLCTAGNVRFGNLRHRDGRLHAGRGTRLLEEVLEGERVHDGAQHAHVVGTAAVHAALGELCTAEEVTPTDDNGDLHLRRNRGDLLGDGAYDIRVHPEGSATERLSRK